MSKLIQTEIEVNNMRIGIMKVGDVDYISLTDIAKASDSNDPSFVIKNWLRKISTINYLGLWEKFHNPNFNLVEFDQIKINAGKNSFVLTPTNWIKRTNAIGIISDRGKYSKGTYAHPDIAFEFASWLSPEFKLYLITEFERLKKDEAYKNKVEWHATRTLTKLNYLVHTDAIKNYIVPELTDKQKRFVYQEEADVLNVALFGMTAKEWRDNNKELAKEGNIRDYTDLIHLVILNNLENINALFIKSGLSQRDRLIKLNEIARNQMDTLLNSRSLKDLEITRDKLLE